MTSIPPPPAVMSRDEFIDSLFTDERRTDAQRLWDELMDNDDLVLVAKLAYRAQGKYDDDRPWDMVADHIGGKLGFESEPERWPGIISFTIGGVFTYRGIGLTYE